MKIKKTDIENNAVIQWDAGGGNPNVVTASSLSDIINADSGAYIDVQDTIVLTSNFQATSGQTWVFTTGRIDKNGNDIDLSGVTIIPNGDKVAFEGDGDITGTIILPNEFHASNFGVVPHGIDLQTASTTIGSNVVNISGANFDDSYIGSFISIKGANSGFSDNLTGQKSFNSTITAVNSPTQIVMADNATRTTTNTLVWSGKNQFDNLKNFFEICNKQKGKTVSFSAGIYNFNTNASDVSNGINTSVAGLLIEKSDGITYNCEGAIFSIIPHNLRQTTAITTRNIHNLTINGGLWRGDLLLHNYSGLPVVNTGDDQNKIFVISSASYKTVFNNSVIQQIDGTLMTSKGDLQFQNYIKGDNVSNVNQRVTDVTLGTIDPITGIVTADPTSDRYYTTTLISINNSLFEDTRNYNPDRKGNRHFQFSGSSFAGWAGFKTREVVAYFYDENDNFLRHTEEFRMYDLIKYGDDVSKVRIVGDAPLDIDEVDGQIRPSLQPVGFTLNNCTFREASAHCMSNMTAQFRMNGGSLSLVYEVLPGFLVNFEDMRDAVWDVVFDGVNMENAFTGYLNFVGTRGVKITNSTLMKNYSPLTQRGTPHSAISTDDNYETIISGNEIQGGSVSVNRGAKYFGNTHKNGSIVFHANSCEVFNNDCVNTVISTSISEPSNRSVSYLYDQKLHFTRQRNNFIIDDRNFNVDIKNVDIILNTKRDVNIEVGLDDTFEPIVLGVSGGLDLFNNISQDRDYGGKIKDFSFSGARRVIASRDGGAENWPVTDMDNVYSEASINLKNGLPKDRTINNLTVDGFLWMPLTQFDGTGGTPTLTFNKLKLTIPAGVFNWTNSDCAVINTSSKVADIIINKGSFNLNVASSFVGTKNRFCKFRHTGILELNDCDFYSLTPKVIDFNEANVVSSDVISVTLRDPKSETITFVLRPQDKMLCKSPSKHCPSYVNNAAALAVLGEGYYYKDTTTGKFEVTIN